MPRATNEYPFEGKVWDGLGRLALQLTGKADEGNGFVAVLNAGGCLLSVFCESEYPDYSKGRKGVEASLFYDPFDGPVYQYIAWENVSAETLERILDIEFVPEDLVSYKGGQLDSVPASHGVMF